MMLTAIWLFTHRYDGIHHDAWFYALQAVRQSRAGAFANDLFFAHGSQDDFSLFSLPYGQLAEWFGLGRAALILLVTAHIAWACFAWMLTRGIPMCTSARWLSLALVFGLPRDYGPNQIFHFAENFLTARPWAEALSLLSLALTLYAKPRMAAATGALAAALHPIIALPCLFFLFAHHAHARWRLLAVISLLVISVALLGPRMDPEWRALVSQPAPFLFLAQWTWGERLEPLAWVGILLAASATTERGPRRFFGAVAFAGIAGISLTLLGAVTESAWLIQIQAWRSLWLTKVTGLIALVALFQRHWRKKSEDRWLLLGLAAAAITATTLGGPMALILAGLAHVKWWRDRPFAGPTWLPWAGGIALVAILLETMLAAGQHVLFAASRWCYWLDGQLPPGDFSAFFDGPLALILPLSLLGVLRVGMRHAKLGQALAMACLLVSASGWYRNKDPLQALLFSPPQQTPRPFGAALASDQTVLWDGRFEYAWFLLRQGNYASRQQSVGIVFSRASAVEAQRRLTRLDEFHHANDALGLIAASLHQICSDPILHAVIHADSIPGSTPPVWKDPLGGPDWHLYRCDDFRGLATADLLPPQRQPRLPV